MDCAADMTHQVCRKFDFFICGNCIKLNVGKVNFKFNWQKIFLLKLTLFMRWSQTYLKYFEKIQFYHPSTFLNCLLLLKEFTRFNFRKETLNIQIFCTNTIQENIPDWRWNCSAWTVNMLEKVLSCVKLIVS